MEEEAIELKEVLTMGDPAAASPILNTARIRDKIRSLGPRPDPITVQNARQALEASNAALAEALESIALAPAPEGTEVTAWRSSQDEKERALREAAEREDLPLRAIVQLDELHQLYDEMLRQAEAVLERGEQSVKHEVATQHEEDTEFFAEVRKDVHQAIEKQAEELNLSKRSLEHVPEVIGKITSLTVLNLSSNQIEVLPDALAGLVNVETLEVQANKLKVLPDSVGLLKNLKFLNVSSNQLKSLPASISGCSSLVEVNVDFNKIDFLPSDFGYGLDSLEKLSLHLNNLRRLPASLCEVKSLKYLDVHFNKLVELPKAIGNLTNLQYLDVSSNFSDLTKLPESMGDLESLSYLDVSYNQLRELPLSLGRLRNVKTFKMDENPLLDPPDELLRAGTEAVMTYLAERWEASLIKEQEAAAAAAAAAASGQQDAGPFSWLPAAAQGTPIPGWISGMYSSVASYVAGYRERHKNEDYLEQQL